MTLLPLAPPQAAPEKPASPSAERRYDFAPEPGQLLAQLLPVTVKVRLFQAFNEAVVGEQIARMTAMKSATDAAGDMRRRLSRQFNRARQTAITTELSEIIGGSAALE
jgi:F-type H+-transporting ATPase subunit gamma